MVDLSKTSEWIDLLKTGKKIESLSITASFFDHVIMSAELKYEICKDPLSHAKDFLILHPNDVFKQEYVIIDFSNMDIPLIFESFKKDNNL